MAASELVKPGWASRIGVALVAHVPPFVVLLIFALAYVLVLDASHPKATHILAPILKSLVPLSMVFVLGAAIVGLIALVLIPSLSLTTSLRWLASRDWPDILCLRLPIALFYTMAIFYLFVSFKINIPNLVPYSWDDFFARFDRMLLLGQDAWRLTHGLFPGTTATILFDMFYLLWFLVLQLSGFSIAVLPSSHPLRLRFLTACGLTWLVAGVVLAIAFASAGPVYMERITGDASFSPLMQRLHAQAQSAEIFALAGHELLWDGYTGANGTPAYGISAFPSLHVAFAALSACLGFAVSRVLGWMLAAFTLIILVGSVHLAWHYAVDGFAGIALAIGFWRSANRLVTWWLARAPQRLGRHAPATPHAAE